MKRVEVHEFRDHTETYLAGDEIVAIERKGKPVGFYVPAGASRREPAAQAIERLEQAVQQVLTETGLTEDELADLFDLTKPLPDEPIRRRGHGKSLDASGD